MGGQCPGAPELKGPPREKKIKKNTRENETFQILGFPFPYCVIKGKKALNFLLRHQGPQISASSHQNGDLQFPITLSGGPNSSLRQGVPIVTSNFPSRYQGAPFPPSRHQRDPFPKYTMRYVLIKKCRILNHIIEINMCKF